MIYSLLLSLLIYGFLFEIFDLLFPIGKMKTVAKSVIFMFIFFEIVKYIFGLFG